MLVLHSSRWKNRRGRPPRQGSIFSAPSIESVDVCLPATGVVSSCRLKKKRSRSTSQIRTTHMLLPSTQKRKRNDKGKNDKKEEVRKSRNGSIVVLSLNTAQNKKKNVSSYPGNSCPSPFLLLRPPPRVRAKKRFPQCAVAARFPANDNKKGGWEEGNRIGPVVM